VFPNGEPDSGYHLCRAIGDPLKLPKLLDDYANNWFQEGGRYLLARLDRPEGAYELKGERDKAIADYRKALSLKSRGFYDDKAKAEASQHLTALRAATSG